MNGARTLLSGLLRLEQWGCALAFAVLVGVLGIDILGREVFGGGKIWATPIAVYANVFMAFVGMGIASAGGAHLRPKFFDQAVPRAWDAVFNRFTDIGFALFAAAACVLCWKLVRETMALAETDAVLQWQVWPFQWFLIVAFAFAVIRHACYATWPSLRPQPALEP
jgi:TRAP-type C4-dicarboxylate transport system permease small subunit